VIEETATDRRTGTGTIAEGVGVAPSRAVAALGEIGTIRAGAAAIEIARPADEVELPTGRDLRVVADAMAGQVLRAASVVSREGAGGRHSRLKHVIIYSSLVVRYYISEYYAVYIIDLL